MRPNTGNYSAPINAPSERYIIRCLSDFENLLISQQTQIDLHLYLQLSSDAFSKNELHEIARLLKNKPCYIFLDCHGIAFVENDILDVATLLSYSSAGAIIYGLDFSQTSISTSALTGILPVLDLSSLLHLNLSYTLISDRFFSEILTLIEDSNALLPLMSFYLRGCYRVGDSDALCHFVAKITQIQTLDLTGIALQASMLTTLTNILCEYEGLNYLSLSCLCNRTSSDHDSNNWDGNVRQIVYSVLQIPQVQTIDLSGTPIKDTGLYYISQVVDKLFAVDYQFSLESINLAYTGMTDKCLSFLKQILRSMKESPLKSISLIGNSLSSTSIEDLQKISKLVGIHLLFDPPLAYYGKSLFSRLLDRDTQFMDKYSLFSLLAHIPIDKLKFSDDSLDKIKSSYTHNDILANALGTYSQNYIETLPYIIDNLPSSSYELPVAILTNRYSSTNRNIAISTGREKKLDRSINTFFSASEIVYSKDHDTSNQCLDSITYTFSSDDEVQTDLLIKETTKVTSVCCKNLEAPSPEAKHSSRLTNTDTERPLAASALLSAVIRNDNSAVPVSPFFKRKTNPHLKIEFVEESNIGPIDTLNEATENRNILIEDVELEPDIIKCVPVIAPQDQALETATFTTEMFVIDESEIIRQKVVEQQAPHEAVSRECSSIHSEENAPGHVDLSSIKSDIINSDDKNIQEPETQVNNQEDALSLQHSVASDSWGSTPRYKITTQNSPFSSSLEEVVTNSDEWSSPCLVEAKSGLNNVPTTGNSTDIKACTTYVLHTPITSLPISESRRAKLLTYMAQTSDDPHASKCGFVNKLKVWRINEQDEEMNDINEFLLALDESLCAAHDCRQVGDAFGLTATANMHESSLVITWFNKLKRKTNATMLFKDILIAELVGSGKSGVIHIATTTVELVLSIADKIECRLFSDLLSLFMANQN